MKYLVIVHGEGRDPARIIVCDSAEERERVTSREIMGNEDDSCPELKNLREDGIVRFEGDPPVEWVTGECVDAEGTPFL